MSGAGLDIGIAPRETASGESPLLEQREWKAATGVLTRAAAVLYLDRLLYGDDEDETPGRGLVDCGLTDGKLVIVLYVYPQRPGGRAPRLAASIGETSAPESEEIEEEETLDFQFEAEAGLRHPALRVLAANWLTGPWNEHGDKVAPPPMTVDGRVLRLAGGAPVYGSVLVRTLVRRWTAAVTVDWAEAVESLNEGWGEIVALYPADAPPVALALAAPPGAAEMAASGRPCGRHYSVRVGGEEETWPPTCPPADKYVWCDYCKGECEDGYRP